MGRSSFGWSRGKEQALPRPGSLSAVWARCQQHRGKPEPWQSATRSRREEENKKEEKIKERPVGSPETAARLQAGRRPLGKPPLNFLLKRSGGGRPVVAFQLLATGSSRSDAATAGGLGGCSRGQELFNSRRNEQESGRWGCACRYCEDTA